MLHSTFSSPSLLTQNI